MPTSTKWGARRVPPNALSLCSSKLRNRTRSAWLTSARKDRDRGTTSRRSISMDCRSRTSKSVPLWRVRPGNEIKVQSWLLQLAESTTDFFDAMARQNARDGHNNLTYWGALAVTATGIATNRQDLFDWGDAKYRAALIEISADGTLPLELGRAAMALHYHLFAVAPLVLIAELGRDNDLDLYAEDNGALHRLVKQTISGLLNPEWFTEKTHVAHELPSELDGSVIGWAVPYEARFPNPAISSLLRKASSTGYWQLGGLPPK